MDNVVDSFNTKDSLNPQIWSSKQRINQEVRSKLLENALDFKDFLDLSELNLDQQVNVTDVQFTGSLANYNWSEFSDIDLHLVFDKKDVDKAYSDAIEDLFQSKKALWNAKRDVEVYGYEVEIYPQDAQQQHHSTGIYSLIQDQWVREPSYQDYQIDRDLIKKKVNGFVRIVDKFAEQTMSPQDTLRGIEKLQQAIKKMRQSGLEQQGEFSVENLIFKTLRRLGTIDNLRQLELDIENKLLSM